MEFVVYIKHFGSTWLDHVYQPFEEFDNYHNLNGVLFKALTIIMW
jgi:hypothetical protein